ncbi:MAG: 4-hydroxy-2-oxovalerate aldolase [Candidatus Micrarchaeota archaeon]|nr:4-hydroxy-2-oxovalerate aldolase [Candidatus Micrarchaeota archaeon]
MKEILIIDSTLRDGSHAMRHHFTAENVRSYAAAAESAGVKVLVVGHGNGLGASSLQIGKSLLSDMEYVSIAMKELKNTKLGVLTVPGFGTVKDDLEPAIKAGAEVVFVTCHCTEADTTQKHIEYVSSIGKEAIGVLMMTHMLSPEGLLEQAQKMQGYGASGILLMDSAGASLPHDVTAKVSALKKGLNVKVGFHAHNNLGMAVANALAAVEAGAAFIDTTMRGYGAGAGNCPMEIITAVLHKSGYATGMDEFALMGISDGIVAKFMKKPIEIDGVRLASGLAGVFSGFCPIAERAGARFGVDPKEILMELGRRKIVAGQEDYITEVAIELAKRKKETKK